MKTNQKIQRSVRTVESCYWINCARAILVILLISASLRHADAQLTTGTIAGSVKDQSGATTPGANITVKNVGTGIPRTSLSGPTGRYEVLNLAVGRYEVSASLPGFQTSIRSGIELTVGRTAIVDHTLRLGEVATAVTVSGEATLVETTTATVSNLVSEQQVENLPLNNRDLTQLSFLQPGVLKVPLVAGQTATAGMGDKLSVAGGRVNSNVYLLDGVSSGDLSGNPQGASGSYSGAETVQEFQVITNNYSAEYQSAAGAIISAVTKSGTNLLKGSLFAFHRNDNFDAPKWEDNAFGDGEKPEFKRSQYGGSLGGPILRDKTFFFGSYEGLRERLSETDTLEVPSERARLGDLSNNPPNPPTVTVAPEVRPYLALQPVPGQGNSVVRQLNGGGVLIAGPSRTPTGDDFLAFKVDHHYSDRHQVSGTYNMNDSERLGPCSIKCQVEGESGSGLGITSLRHIVSFGLTTSISPTSLNEFRFGFTRTAPQDAVILGDAEATSGLRFTDVRNRVGELSTPAPGTHVGFEQDEATNIQETLTFKDGVSLTRGNHSFRFGGELTRYFYDNRSCADGCAGSYRFATFADFLRGIPDQSADMVADRDGRGTGAPHLLTQWMLGAYFQDNWQFRPSLALNLGMRYETITVPGGEQANTAALINLGDPETVIGPPYQNASKKSFGPRLGFAWSPGDRKTSIRGGFGIFYMFPRLFELRTANQQTPPFVQVRTLDARTNGIINNTNIRLRFPDAFYAGQFDLVEPTLNIRVPQYQQENTYGYRWSLTVQRETLGWVLQAGYTGSRHLHLWVQNTSNMYQWLIKESRDPNSDTVGAFPSNPQPGQYKYWPAPNDPLFRGVRINPRFSSFWLQSTNGNSYYHGLALGAQKRLSHGLQLQLAFNWSKAIDQGAGVTNGGEGLNEGQRTLYAFDMDFRRGLSTIDIRRNLVGNFSYDIPKIAIGRVGNAFLNGWQLNGILTLSDGAPVTILSTVNEQNLRIGETNGLRPDLISNGNANPTEGVAGACAGTRAGQKLHTPEIWFDPCQFVPAVPGFFGNLGRSTIGTPGIATLDGSLFKNFQIGENGKLQFRAEFFNLFNRPNFRPPSTTIFPNGSTRANITYNATGGRITTTRGSAREVQFGLRFSF